MPGKPLSPCQHPGLQASDWQEKGRWGRGRSSEEKRRVGAGRSMLENEALKAIPLQSGPTHPLVIQKRGGIETGSWSFLAGCDIFGQEVRVVATQKEPCWYSGHTDLATAWHTCPTRDPWDRTS